MFLIGSPMCTRFCTWQGLNDHRRDAGVVHREHVQAMVHLRFVCELYRDQVNEGRYFLHEHPAGASSWTEECVEEVAQLEEVDTVIGDRCQYGQEEEVSGDPLKKPTKWMSNSHCILEALSR